MMGEAAFSNRSIHFCNDVADILDRLDNCADGALDAVLVRPAWAAGGGELLAGLRNRGCLQVWCMPSDGHGPGAAPVCDGEEREGVILRRAESAVTCRTVVVLHDDPSLLQSVLDEYLDCRDVALFCLKTVWYGQNRPVFLTSIPKSGTHLMFGLLEKLGFARGAHSDGGNYAPGHYHPLTADFFHGPARKWFTDQSLAGALSHPAMHHPICFGYRNPLDTLVSEADYYVQPKRTILPYYFSCLGDRNRVIEELCRGGALDPVRDRMEQYLPWFRLPNVIPVAYEEAGGGRGGASDVVQQDLLWSLQLKLHVSGAPADYAGRLYDTGSNTYNVGRIGRFRDTCLNDAAFLARHPDLLQMVEDFGYGHTLPGRALPDASPMPAGRPYLRRSGPYRLIGEPVRGVGHAFCFRDRAGGFFALPAVFAELDFEITPPRKLPGCLVASNLEGLMAAAADPAYQTYAEAAGAVGTELGFSIHGMGGNDAGGNFVAVPRTGDACVLAELIRNAPVRGDTRKACEDALMRGVGEVLRSRKIEIPLIVATGPEANIVFYDGIVYAVALSEGFVSFSRAPEDRERYGRFPQLFTVEDAGPFADGRMLEKLGLLLQSLYPARHPARTAS